MNRSAAKLPPQSEDEFLRQVMELAVLSGWATAHFRPAMTKGGRWVTAVSGDGKGWPDLVLVNDRVIFAELKTDAGTLTPDQERWGRNLKAAGAEYYVWRPRDWPVIVATLGRRAAGTPPPSPGGT